MLRLRDIAERDVVSLAPQTTLDDAARLFARWRLSMAPVLLHGRLLGVVSVRALVAPAAPGAARPRDAEATVRSPAARAWHAELGPRVVADLPYESGYVLPPDTTLDVAGAYVRSTGAEFVFLLDQGRLAGIVSAALILLSA
jgi:CBS domain-containing protein